MNKVVIVCDLADHFLENRIFTDEAQKRFPWGESFWIKLNDLCKISEWEIITSDIFLKLYLQQYSSYKSYLISHMVTSRTYDLLNKVSVPLLLYSLESPNVALSFYSKIFQIAPRYKYSMLFGGVASAINNITNSLVLYWPNTLKSLIIKNDWNNRKHICLIASNKSKYDVLPGKPFKFLRKILKSLFLDYIDRRYPFIRSKDLYEFRYRAIDYFAETGKFNLFGNNWNERGSIKSSNFLRIEKIKPQRVDDKIETLGMFKYALCFENCIYPGYVTEKIFDCFFAGTIPVYFGAPDIGNFVPRECFIDFRDFNDLRKLDKYLSDLTKEKADYFHNNAAAFMESLEFTKFTDIYVANTIFQLVQKER